MNITRILLIIATIMIGLCLCQKLSAQEINQLIKTERYYKLYGVKERLDLESYSPEELENYISSEFKYDIDKEFTYDKSGRIIQKKVFRRAGVALMAVETTSNFSYNKDTITRKDYNEDGTLRIISRYREIEDERQTFLHSVFRVPDVMAREISSKPLRREKIHHYNLAEREQQELVSNLSDTFPVELIFKNEVKENGFVKTTTSSSSESWPPDLLRLQIKDPITGKSVVYHCLSTYEEIDIASFPMNSDTLRHRIYQKVLVNFGQRKEKSPRFRPDQSIPGDTIKHEEWITLIPNDSMRITSHFIPRGYKDIQKNEQHYLHDLLVKESESKLKAGVWKNYYTKNYIRYKNFCLVEIEKQHNKGRSKHYYLSVYDYY